MSDVVDAEPEVFEIDADPDPEDGVGLCLSGGGFRAMLFHVGTLRRLNETGWLAKLDIVSSVSGGSITAGVLGLAWQDLKFDNGVAVNLEELVEEPLLDFATHFIDVRALLSAALIPGVIAKRVQRLYDKYLFHGATLQSLPKKDEGPLFVILATNLTNAGLWRFSQRFMHDWRSEPIAYPALPLAHAVAASSAFPPFLTPSVLKVDGRSAVHLGDGGIYDNLGLEPVLKNCRTVFVSDGGGPFRDKPEPPKDWARSLLHVLNVVDVEVRRLRRRQVVGLLVAKRRRGTFFAINTDYSRFRTRSSTLPAIFDQTFQLANVKTRLCRLSRTRRRQLVNWGYAACDAGLRSYVDPSLAEPAGFPFPDEALPPPLAR